MTNLVETAYNSVPDAIRQSNLNFVLQETPYSSYITIRKRFSKSRNNLGNINQSVISCEGKALIDAQIAHNEINKQLESIKKVVVKF